MKRVSIRNPNNAAYRIVPAPGGKWQAQRYEPEVVGNVEIARKDRDAWRGLHRPTDFIAATRQARFNARTLHPFACLRTAVDSGLLVLKRV